MSRDDDNPSLFRGDPSMLLLDEAISEEVRRRPRRADGDRGSAFGHDDGYDAGRVDGDEDGEPAPLRLFVGVDDGREEPTEDLGGAPMVALSFSSADTAPGPRWWEVDDDDDEAIEAVEADTGELLAAVAVEDDADEDTEASRVAAPPPIVPVRPSLPEELYAQAVAPRPEPGDSLLTPLDDPDDASQGLLDRRRTAAQARAAARRAQGAPLADEPLPLTHTTHDDGRREFWFRAGLVALFLGVVAVAGQTVWRSVEADRAAEASRLAAAERADAAERRAAARAQSSTESSVPQGPAASPAGGRDGAVASSAALLAKQAVPTGDAVPTPPPQVGSPASAPSTSTEPSAPASAAPTTGTPGAPPAVATVAATGSEDAAQTLDTPFGQYEVHWVDEVAAVVQEWAGGTATPKTAPPPQVAQGDGRRTSEAVEARLDALWATGVLQVQTDAPAVVWLNGQRLGRTPLDPMPLEIGWHELRVLQLGTGRAIRTRTRIDGGHARVVSITFAAEGKPQARSSG